MAKMSSLTSRPRCVPPGTRHSRRCQAFSGRGARRSSTPDPRQHLEDHPQEDRVTPEHDKAFVDESWEKDIEGNVTGMLTQNTELGRAVDDACSEMHRLSGMENDVLQEAQGLLEKMGYKKSIFDDPEAQDTDADNDSSA